MKTQWFLASVILLALASVQAAAEGCPKKPVAEEGGMHWCYWEGRLGHVHLWKPDGYEAKHAVTVVYVHGYNLSGDGRQVYGKGSGIDGCANAHYVDCAWDAHHLAKQFAASGLDALFVAVEGPNNDGQKPKWTSLGDLLHSIRGSGHAKPPSAVIAIGHSAGIFTVAQFVGDKRLAHVVALDAMYTYAPRRLAKWYKGSGERRLTLIGAEGTSTATEALSQKLGCASSNDLALPLTSELKDARCAAIIDGTVGHMDVIKDGNTIPLVLTRKMLAPPPKAEKHTRPVRRPYKPKRRSTRHR